MAGFYKKIDANSNSDMIKKFENFRYFNKFASDVYDDKTKLNKYKILDEITTNSNPFSLEARIYKDEENKKVIVAFRGSQEILPDFGVADGSLLTHQMPFQFLETAKFIGKNEQELLELKKQGYEINITGHSLGGANAMFGAKAFPNLFDKGYTFNAPSPNNLQLPYQVRKSDNGEYKAINATIGNHFKAFFKVALNAFASDEKKRQILEDAYKVEYLSQTELKALYNYQKDSGVRMTTEFHHLINKNGIEPVANLWFKDRPNKENIVHIIGPKWGIKQPHSNEQMGKDISMYLNGLKDGKTLSQIDQIQKNRYFILATEKNENLQNFQQYQPSPSEWQNLQNNLNSWGM